MPAPKIDLYKEHRDEYNATSEPVLVDVGTATYLAIAGEGAPGGDAFQAAIGALYGIAFTVKMTRKFGGMQDYVVSKLEGQYWGADESRDGNALSDLRWRLMIRTPEFVAKEELTDAIGKLKEKGRGERAHEVELITFTEGPCVQMLHVGPYEREHETIAAMREWAEAQGHGLAEGHHEIYLSDPRRVPPERLKTILRLPVEPS